MNRLSFEKSPYLLEHAQNPVHWFAWSEEAFAKARLENKPVFLSIGYSTCHWCHVMQEESFENMQIASFLNEHFISIKVDREERPDLDHVYMASVTAMTGHGGWPLTVFLTPEKLPFFGGTYFPAFAKWGSPGFLDILSSIVHTWKTNQSEVVQSAQGLSDLLRQRFDVRHDGVILSEDIFDRAYERLSRQFDSVHGGFGQAPKFPMGHTLSLLMRYWQRTGCGQALDMAAETLRALALGGIFDQLAGGFHRYSTDRQWRVPHFEKMLYDQALLAKAYCEAYQATKDKFFAQIARKVLDFVLNELTDPRGGFYCAQDADSVDRAGHKREGAFYVWEIEEISAQLTSLERDVAIYFYGLKSEGNAIEDPHEEFIGKNILYVNHSFEETARHFQIDKNRMNEIIFTVNSKLLECRRLRKRPHLDDKVLTDWNGLMIATFALASEILQEPKYIQAAVKASDFILTMLIDNDGRLLHRYRDGESAIPGSLDDYAFFVSGLLDVYEASGEARFFSHAKRLLDQMRNHFEDKQVGGFFMTSHEASDLFVRSKESYDGALPSGNSVAILNLLRLFHLTTEDDYRKAAQKAFECFSKQTFDAPEAHAFLLSAYDFFLGPVDEIVVDGKFEDSEYQEMYKLIYNEFRPNKVLAWSGKSENIKSDVEPVPIIVRDKIQQGRKTNGFFFCRDRMCMKPAEDVEAWKSVLSVNQPSRRMMR